MTSTGAMTVMVENAYTGRRMPYIITVEPSNITEHFKGIMIMKAMHSAALAFASLLVNQLYLHIVTDKYRRMPANAFVIMISATWFSNTFESIPTAQAY
jgi:hypothetical protein